MDKPNFKEIREQLNSLRASDKRLKSLTKENTKIEKQIVKDTEKYLEEEFDLALKHTSIDEVNRSKLGIRMSALKNAGYVSLWQIRDYKESDFLRIHGIGEGSAALLVEARDALVEDIRGNLKIDLSGESGNQYAEALVKDLYQQKKLAELRSQAEKLYGQSHEKVEALKKDLKSAKNPIKWLTSGIRKKQTAMDASEILKNFGDDFVFESSEIFAKEESTVRAEHKEYWDDFARNSSVYYSNLESTVENKGKKDGKVSADVKSTALKSGLSEEFITEIEAVQVDTTGITPGYSLRPYQKFGVQYILNQGCCLLGDEMGLGKTAQAIATMVALRNSGATHFFVAAPASVLSNWESEVKKWCDLKPTVIHGFDKLDELKEWMDEGGVAISNYESISKLVLPDDFKFNMLIADEAHYVKNPQSQRTKALMELRKHTGRVLFMTGTPIENNLAEMIFLISCLQPKLAAQVGASGKLTAVDFRRMIAPVYIRRTQKDVLTELPSKTESVEYCEMGDAESKTYCASVLEKNFMAMRQVSWNCESIADSCKAQRLKELCDEAAGNNRKVIVFSFFLHTIQQAMSMFPDIKCFGPLNGSISPEARQKMIDEFTAYEGGALLFSQIQAGGTGLNIQAASVVIFCEPQLKPSLENQAVARAYRMGQINMVNVYRLICQKTVDELVIVRLKKKQELFDQYAEESVSGKETLISDADINEMIESENARVQNAG